jgi:putative glutamine amidotransferase
MLHRIVGVKHMRVNSVHNQGVDQLAPNLCIEARSDDGVIEAVSPRDAKTFQLGVQWHPEWRSDLDEPSTKIFRAFAAACADRAHKEYLSR